MRSISETELFEKAHNNLFDFVLENTVHSDSAVVFTYYGIRFSLDTFCSDVYRAVDTLLDMHVCAGDRILLSLLSTPESIALLYACSLIGAVPVMTDVRLSASELYSLICDTKVKIAFLNDFQVTDPKLLTSPSTLERLFVITPCDRLPAVARCLRRFSEAWTGKPYLLFRSKHSKLSFWYDLVCDQSKGLRRHDFPHAKDGQLLFTTSGTTGSRKYVRISSFALNLAACRYELFMDVSKISSVLSVMPIFTCYGFLNSIHAPLLYGKELFLYPIYCFQAFPRVLLKTQASATFGVLGQWTALLKDRSAAKSDLSFLKFASWGGDGCSNEQIADINRFFASHGSATKLYQGYGMTETVSTATLQTPEDYVLGSAGKPLPFTKICIVADGTDRPLHAGEIGEICIHSLCQTTGYDFDDNDTVRLIHVHEDGRRWIHSGDIGYVDEDGLLFVVGRKKRMIVTENGTKVFLSRLEELLCNENLAEDSAAIAVSASANRAEKQIILYVVPKAGISERRQKSEIQAAVRKKLPDYLYPNQILFVKHIPKNALGKPDYPELTALWEARAADI